MSEGIEEGKGLTKRGSKETCKKASSPAKDGAAAGEAACHSRRSGRSYSLVEPLLNLSK